MKLNKMEQSIIDEDKKIYSDGCACGPTDPMRCAYCQGVMIRLEGAGVAPERVEKILSVERFVGMYTQEPPEREEAQEADLVAEHTKCMPDTHLVGDGVTDDSAALQRKVDEVPTHAADSLKLAFEADDIIQDFRKECLKRGSEKLRAEIKEHCAEEEPFDLKASMEKRDRQMNMTNTEVRADDMNHEVQAVLDDLEAKRVLKTLSDTPIDELLRASTEELIADGWVWHTQIHKWVKDCRPGPLTTPTAETIKEVADAFAEQGMGLEKGGADLIIIETMTDLQEAGIAVSACKEKSC